MKKNIILFCVLLFVAALFGCTESAVLKEIRVYRVESDIHSLEIQVGAADFAIRPAEEFSVESNLKYLSVSEEDGVLKIIDKKEIRVTYKGPVLTLYMPADMVFEQVDITTGAAKLTVDELAAKSLKLRLGAGDVNITKLDVENHANIEGGAGKITIAGGTMNNLELEMGVGELNLTAALQGDNELTFGVGESNLTLIGSRDDYQIDLEKGIGSISVNGETVTDFSGSGNGQNRVEMEGGVGAINLWFQVPENEDYWV